MTKKNKLVNLAITSLIHEVSLYPKPGLVDPIDVGSHSDMDYFTFIDSAFALQAGFENYYEAGKNHQGDLSSLFEKIRIVGSENEKVMFSATGQVNTHKGANFMYGILISAIAYLDFPDLVALQLAVKKMTHGLVHRELASLLHYKTHGEIMYKLHGFTGIRGEVEQGIPHAFNIALPILKRNENYQLGLKKALLALLISNDDTNMVKRGGIEGLNYGKSLALQKFEDIDEHLLMMNEEFVKYNLSPGGSADLLAIAIFLKNYEETFI